VQGLHKPIEAWPQEGMNMSHPNEAYMSLPAVDEVSQDLLSLGSGDIEHRLSYQLKVLSILDHADITIRSLTYLLVEDEYIVNDVLDGRGLDYVPVSVYDHLREEGSRATYRILRDWMRLWNAESYDIVEDYRTQKHQGSV
jgi:hypothetical protein